MRFILSNVRRFLRNEAGFSLLELSVALAVMGIVAASGLSLMGARVSAAQEKVTREHQTFVLKSLANYLLSQKKLPCPSPDLKGFAKERCESPNEAVGYIPFETLGLSSRVAQDGWGKVMRYGVHPKMTNFTDGTNEDKVEAICKVSEGSFVIKKDGRLLASPQKDPFTVVVYSQGTAIGHPSDSERVNDAQDLHFVDKEVSAHKDHPHRHLLIYVTRNDFLGHYAGFSCPGYVVQRSVINSKTPLKGEALPPSVSPVKETGDFSWGE